MRIPIPVPVLDIRVRRFPTFPSMVIRKNVILGKPDFGHSIYGTNSDEFSGDVVPRGVTKGLRFAVSHDPFGVGGGGRVAVGVRGRGGVGFVVVAFDGEVDVRGCGFDFIDVDMKTFGVLTLLRYLQDAEQQKLSIQYVKIPAPTNPSATQGPNPDSKQIFPLSTPVKLG